MNPERMARQFLNQQKNLDEMIRALPEADRTPYQNIQVRLMFLEQYALHDSIGRAPQPLTSPTANPGYSPVLSELSGTRGSSGISSVSSRLPASPLTLPLPTRSETPSKPTSSGARGSGERSQTRGQTARDIKVYPIAVYQDRYGGTYVAHKGLRGSWVAFADIDRHHWSPSNNEGPWDDDISACTWWEYHHDVPWIGVGYSPTEAWDRLLINMAEEDLGKDVP